MSAAQSKNKSFGSFINPVFHENAKEDFFQDNKRNTYSYGIQFYIIGK